MTARALAIAAALVATNVSAATIEGPFDVWVDPPGLQQAVEAFLRRQLPALKACALRDVTVSPAEPMALARVRPGDYEDDLLFAGDFLQTRCAQVIARQWDWREVGGLVSTTFRFSFATSDEERRAARRADQQFIAGFCEAFKKQVRSNPTSKSALDDAIDASWNEGSYVTLGFLQGLQQTAYRSPYAVDETGRETARRMGFEFACPELTEWATRVFVPLDESEDDASMGEATAAISGAIGGITSSVPPLPPPPPPGSPGNGAPSDDTEGVEGGIAGGAVGGIAGGPPAQSEGSPIPFGEGLTRPVQLSGRKPGYTPAAKNARVQGTMIVKCTVETDGSISNCRILKPLPHLEQEVLSALQTWKMTPATRDGEPVRVEYPFVLRFALEE